MKTPNGVILWEGASSIDGAPIVVIATGIRGRSRNAKTGKMIQTWILRSDIAPHKATKSGADRSVCGDCKLRPANKALRAEGAKGCYVTVFQAPRSVYATFKRGRYPRVSPAEAAELFAGRKLRLGSYGNPSAAPLSMWRTVTARTAGHTGYIHNWRDAEKQWSELVMASVESVAEGIRARKLGYRLFRVTSDAADKLASEVRCPASAEAGHKTNCASCLACGGRSAKAKADIVIAFH